MLRISTLLLLQLCDEPFGFLLLFDNDVANTKVGHDSGLSMQQVLKAKEIREDALVMHNCIEVAGRSLHVNSVG